MGSVGERAVIRGKAHVYSRAHINTDEIIPARYLNTHEHAELAKHAMEDIDPAFLSRVQPGDIMVGGEDFGCGSSREHAVWALRTAGISCVIASNFARIFFRNSLNNGFLSIECAGFADKAKNGDDLEVDLAKGVILKPQMARTSHRSFFETPPPKKNNTRCCSNFLAFCL